jgi:hypothetical protein
MTATDRKGSNFAGGVCTGVVRRLQVVVPLNSQYPSIPEWYDEALRAIRRTTPE